jgi:hypothetical protein
MEPFYLLAPNLTAFELMSLLIVCPRRVSFHQLRRGCYASKQDRLVGLIQALCAGKVELINKFPNYLNSLNTLATLHYFGIPLIIMDLLCNKPVCRRAQIQPRFHRL